MLTKTWTRRTAPGGEAQHSEGQPLTFRPERRSLAAGKAEIRGGDGPQLGDRAWKSAAQYGSQHQGRMRAGHRDGGHTIVYRPGERGKLPLFKKKQSFLTVNLNFGNNCRRMHCRRECINVSQKRAKSDRPKKSTQSKKKRKSNK